MKTSRRVLPWAAAGSTAAVLALVAASAAFAVPTPQVTKPNVQWVLVDDRVPSLNDAQAVYPDLLGTGVAMSAGWTADAFDGALTSWEVEHAGSTNGLTWTPGTQSTAGGRSTWTYTGLDPVSGVEVAASLELEGSTVRWTVTRLAGPTDAVIRSFANFGSDGAGSVVQVAPDTAVVSSDDTAVDPVLGIAIDAVDGQVVSSSGQGGANFAFSTAGPASIVIALQDYAPCAEQVAIDEMVARVATLTSSFGQTIEGALDCAAIAPAAALVEGTPVAQDLDLTIDPAVDLVTQADSGNIGFDSPAGAYLATPTVVESVTTGLPAGVVATVDPATQTVSLSGTPTQTGVFDVRVVLYRTDVRDYLIGNVGAGAPVVARLALTVAAAPAGPGGGTPGAGGPGSGLPQAGGGTGMASGTGTAAARRNLPDTGAGSVPAAVLGLSLLAAGALAVTAGRRAGRA